MVLTIFGPPTAVDNAYQVVNIDLYPVTPRLPKISFPFVWQSIHLAQRENTLVYEAMAHFLHLFSLVYLRCPAFSFQISFSVVFGHLLLPFIALSTVCYT